MLSWLKPGGALDMETARSEQLRSRILSVAFLSTALIVIILAGVIPDDVLATLDIPAFRNPVFALLLLIGLYEGATSLLFGVMEKNGKRVPLFGRIANATVEISIPGAGMLIIGQSVHPVHALLSPLVALYFIFIIVSILRLSAGLSLYTGVLAALQYGGLVWYVLSTSDTSAVDPVFATPLFYASRCTLLMVAGAAAAIITKHLRSRIAGMLHAAEEKRQVIQLFGQQVSEPVATELLSHPEHAEGVLKTVTVLFLDIRDFTPLVGSRPPREVVSYLNTVFGTLIPIIARHGGIVNQFLGDGFMATFGAPVGSEDHAANAVNAALAMHSAIQRLNTQGSIPYTRIGIGVHTGEAVTGNIGTEGRRQYSVTGSAVILASRIEQLNKTYNSSVLISGSTWNCIDHRSLFTESLGTAILKGCNDPVVIYKLA
jgi:adenylate cyclase